MYLEAKGRILLPNHMSLAMAVRHLTGSAKLIGLLNGFGHCVSNSAGLEHDTALAKIQLAQGLSIFSAGTWDTYTTLVWDNNDFGEETVSGKGTTHNTNGILLQWCPSTSEASQSVPIPRDRERSVQPPSPNIKKYYGSKRIGLKSDGKHIDLLDRHHRPVQSLARKLDLALRMMKLADPSDRVFPVWTGCNTLLQKEVPEMCSIAYLPIIDASPTEYDTVCTVLEKSLEIADALKQEEVVVVFDQAIHFKAQQIRWGNKRFSEWVILRLGAFHTSLVMLACIGKRFRDAGLETLVIEAGIVVQESLNGAMNGHHCNRSIRMHKCVVEAMECLRWQSFLDYCRRG